MSIHEVLPDHHSGGVIADPSSLDELVGLFAPDAVVQR
jgi:hypothetical protein